MPFGLNPVIEKFLTDMMSGGIDPIRLFKTVLQFHNMVKDYGVEPDMHTMAALQITSDRYATDPREEIYGLGDLVNLGIQIDYSVPVKDLYEGFASGQVKTLSNLSFLLEYAGMNRSSEHLYLPSWVPDWDWVSKNSHGAWRGVTHGNAYNTHHSLSILPKTTILAEASGAILSILGISNDVVSDVMSLSLDDHAAKDVEGYKNAAAIEFLFQTDLRAVTASFVEHALQSRYVTGINTFFAVLERLFKTKTRRTKSLDLIIMQIHPLFRLQHSCLSWMT
jgi:hypothetical protein